MHEDSGLRTSSTAAYLPFSFCWIYLLTAQFQQRWRRSPPRRGRPRRNRSVRRCRPQRRSPRDSLRPSSRQVKATGTASPSSPVEVQSRPLPIPSRFRCLTTDNDDEQAGDPQPNLSGPTSAMSKSGTDAAGFGIGIYAVILIGGALAFGAYKYLQVNQMAQKA